MRRAPGLERRWSAVAAIVATLTLSGSGAAAAAPSGWTRIEHPALVGGNSISYVMDVLPPERGSGWLAGGFVVDPDGIRTPAVWGSRDGATWRRTALPPAPSTEPRDGVYEIARRGDVAVAVGERFANGVRTAAWHATGGKWSPLTDEGDALLRFAGRIVDVTASPTGFLAVGSDARNTLVEVLESADGRSWHLLSTIPLRAGERFSPSAIIAAGARVLVSGEALTAGRSQGRIYSWDGSGWAQADPVRSGMTGPGRTQVASLAYLPRLGFVAGGLARPATVEQPAAWSSRDGVRWVRLPESAVPFPTGGAAVHSIVVAGGRFVAAGNSHSGPVLWQTSDGRHWSTIDAPTKRNVADWANVTVASTGPVTVLAVAGDGAADAYRRGPAGRWSVIDRAPAFPGASGGVALLRDVAASRDRLVAVGHDARGRALILTSANARSWSRAPLPDPHARLEAVAVSHGVFAVAGWRLLKGKAHVALWTSTNGRRWRRLGGGALDPVGAFVDVAPDGAGFVLGAFEGSPRGLQVSTWSAGARGLTPGRILGPGETRAICSGPHGATVIATRGAGRDEQVLAWHRRSGVWSRASETVAASAEAADCADGTTGTLVVGSGATGGTAVAWTQDSAGAPWRPTVLADTLPRSALFGVTRVGRGFATTGQGGARGQLDLVLWTTSGSGWSSVGGSAPVFSEPGAQAGLALVTFAGRIVVVGETGTGNGAIWTGTDGPATPPAAGPS